MIENTITIYDATDKHPIRVGVSIFESIAEKHGVKNEEYIRDKKKFKEIFIDNCHHGIAICKLNIAMDEEFERV